MVAYLTFALFERTQRAPRAAQLVPEVAISFSRNLASSETRLSHSTRPGREKYMNGASFWSSWPAECRNIPKFDIEVLETLLYRGYSGIGHSAHARSIQEARLYCTRGMGWAFYDCVSLSVGAQLCAAFDKNVLRTRGCVCSKKRTLDILLYLPHV